MSDRVVVFICHYGDEMRTLATELAQVLTDVGFQISPWIHPAERLVQGIGGAIESSDIVIMLLSNAAWGREPQWAQIEAEIAFAARNNPTKRTRCVLVFSVGDLDVAQLPAYIRDQPIYDFHAYGMWAIARSAAEELRLEWEQQLISIISLTTAELERWWMTQGFVDCARAMCPRLSIEQVREQLLHRYGDSPTELAPFLADDGATRGPTVADLVATATNRANELRLALRTRRIIPHLAPVPHNRALQLNSGEHCLVLIDLFSLQNPDLADRVRRLVTFPDAHYGTYVLFPPPGYSEQTTQLRGCVRHAAYQVPHLNNALDAFLNVARANVPANLTYSYHAIEEASKEGVLHSILRLAMRSNSVPANRPNDARRIRAQRSDPGWRGEGWFFGGRGTRGS